MTMQVEYLGDWCECGHRKQDHYYSSSNFKYKSDLWLSCLFCKCDKFKSALVTNTINLKAFIMIDST